MKRKNFYVLLAIDGAGKSTLLELVKEIPDWLLVTYDREYIPPEYELLGKVDDALRKGEIEKFPILSRDFKSSIYSVYISYLHALTKKYWKEKNILCNSYYYKILAKDIIMDGYNEKFHKNWEKLDQPDKIIFLDTPPEVAWERIANKKLYNNEFYGSRPTRKGYIKFQKKLREKMFELTSNIDSIILDGCKSKEELKRAVIKLLT